MDAGSNREHGDMMQGEGLSRRTRITWLLVLGLFIVLAVLNFQVAIVVTLFLVALLLHVNRSIPLAVSLALLFLCALMTALQQQPAAKVLAEWAYYFLAIGVVLIFIDHVKAGPDNADTTDK